MPEVAIDVWMARLDPHDSRIGLCSDEERRRADGFRDPSSGRRWLAGRGALRLVLGEATGDDPARIRFGEGPHGKPAVNRGGPHFNLAHSGQTVAIAVGDRPVGIDIEAPRRLLSPSRLAQRLWGLEGCRTWEGLPEPNRTVELLQQWTRTEALLKATGTGIAGGTRDAVERLTGEGWGLRDLAVPPLVGAVAARGDDWEVRGPHWLEDDSVLDPQTVVGLLADRNRLAVVAALTLGAKTPADVAAATHLPAAAVQRAVHRLAAERLVAIEAGSLRVLEENLRATAKANRPPPDEHRDVLRNFFRNGRLTTIPAARAKRLVVLDHLSTRFDPGRTYPEKAVNETLAAVHPDYATLRRYLVDEGFLERRDGFYWRAGGTFDVE